MRKAMMAATAAMMVSGGVSAANFGASVNYGLGGLGADLGYSLIQDTVNVRAGLNAGLDMSGTFKSDGIDYRYNVDTGYKTLGLDWHPFSGGFRVSAGYAWSDIKGDLNYTSDGSQKVGNTNVPAGTKAMASVKYDNAPYVSIGWGNHAPSKGGLFFNSELGMMFTGKASVNLSTSDQNFNNTFANDIRVEAEKIRKDAPDFFPILKLGVGYTF
jgi:hypothetical protein